MIWPGIIKSGCEFSGFFALADLYHVELIGDDFRR